MHIEVITEPTHEEIQSVIDGVNRHNAPHFAAIRSQDFTCFVYDDNGEKSGGLYGELWGNWLLVKYLWVSPGSKGKGLGRELLQKAEAFAIDKGCHSVFLDTYSFQAKPFYEKQGYKVEMALTQYPVTDTRYYLRKTLK
ncbi:GNAT family N-acetyltransferase [Oceanospirillum sanctuarii]|uniref:GNAT family N-acetyltransferase n=1 Tax=Oceanospirillum sanctuarii TaxID=1434821 RepID=UPI000A3C5785|nr:GNAT family N-acetyltransferase [Oceanospirillum sanctuarii]